MPAPAEVREGRLVEREAELFALRELVADVADGRSGRAVVVEGEAGIGKTSLLGALRAIADRAGCAVAATTCGELETDLSFGALRELTRALGIDLGAAIGDASASPAAFDAIHWQCVERAEAAPLVLVVDDVQWCDGPSARFLAYLLRRLDDAPILVALGRRDGGAATVADVAAGTARALVLRPGPLSEEATAELVRRVDPLTEPTRCAAVHRAAAGNPFFVLTLAEAVAQSPGSSIGELSPGAATRTILTRLGGLGPDATRTAMAVAILGRETLVRRVASLAGLSPERAAEAADALVDHGFLTASSLDFAHPVVRTAVVGEVAPAARVDLHARAARLLHGDGLASATVAAHLLEAEPGQGAWARDVLLDAGSTALAGGDFPLALRCADHVLAAGAGERREDGLVLRAHALLGLGAPDAEAAGVRILGDLGPEAGAALAVPLSFRMIIAGRDRAARALLDDTRSATADRETGLRLAAAAARAAAMAGDRDDLERRLDEAGAMTLAGATAGERAVLQEAVFARLGDASDAEALLALARRAAGDWGDAEPPVLSAFAIGLAGELDEAIAAHDRVIDAGRRRFGEAFASTLIANRATTLLRRGRIAEAHADATVAARLSARDPDAAAAAGWTRAIVALTTALTGDLVGAEVLLADVADAEPTDLPSAIVWEQRARLAALAGRPREAADRYTVLGGWLTAQRITNPAWWPWRSASARVLAVLGEEDEARRLAEEEWRDARRFDAAPAIGAALVAVGVARGGEEGLASLREAVEVLASSQARGAEADALLSLGAALRRAGHREEARERLRSALSVADRGGMGLLAAAAEAELRAAGGRPRRRALEGPASLTPSEHRVARLAADGLSNPQIARTLFLTRKTVETHLGRVYVKLAIGGRAELAAALAAAG